MASILQDWILTLGLRHQGVLLTAVRGPDNTPKECPSKALVRVYRAMILRAHCGDPLKSKSFIELPSYDTILARMNAVVKDHDALPHHFLMHFIHAAEIVGYKHPDRGLRSLWFGFYQSMCNKLHMVSETEDMLDKRLNADEDTFASKQ